MSDLEGLRTEISELDRRLLALLNRRPARLAAVRHREDQALEPVPSLAEAVADAELVVVAVPVGAAPTVVRETLDAVGTEAVVTDVASTQRPLAAVDDPRFVPGHPVAGGATGGPARATADLF